VWLVAPAAWQLRKQDLRGLLTGQDAKLFCAWHAGQHN
jgi:hypothetical protein